MSDEPAQARRAPDLTWLPGRTPMITVLTSRSRLWATGGFTLDARFPACAGDASQPGVADLATATAPARAERLRQGPWTALDSVMLDREFLLLQVDAPMAPPPSCELAHDPVLRASGIQMVESELAVFPGPELHSATVSYRGAAHRPALTARTPALVVDRNGDALPFGPYSLRMYLSPDSFTPDGHGRFADLVISVSYADATRPAQINVPASTVAEVWNELTLRRLARASTSGAAGAVPALRRPADPVLQDAAGLLTSGEPLAAARLATRRAERRAAAGIAADDRRFVHLLVGAVFLAAGDSVSARAAYGAALDQTPCLRFAGHPASDRMLAQLRRDGVRCSTLSPAKQLLWGAVVPGGGLWAARGDRIAAAVTTTLTTTLLAAAVYHHSQAQRQYDAYHTAPGPGPVDLMLDRANATQRTARNELVAATTVWITSAITGLVAEALHQRRVEAARYTTQTTRDSR